MEALYHIINKSQVKNRIKDVILIRGEGLLLIRQSEYRLFPAEIIPRGLCYWPGRFWRYGLSALYN